eukprot:10185681-Alexandrium_andersonii.AAC.1
MFKRRFAAAGCLKVGTYARAYAQPAKNPGAEHSHAVHKLATCVQPGVSVRETTVKPPLQR